MRRSVDFPAPLAPTSARTSPLLRLRTKCRAKQGPSAAETGCTNARHPEAAGGKYFSTFSRLSAKFFTSRRYILSNGAKQGPPVFSRNAGRPNRIAVSAPEPLQFRALAGRRLNSGMRPAFVDSNAARRANPSAVSLWISRGKGRMSMSHNNFRSFRRCSGQGPGLLRPCRGSRDPEHKKRRLLRSRSGRGANLEPDAGAARGCRDSKRDHG